MLYLIDGTGSGDTDKYIADMSRGFCWDLDTRNGGAAFWLRGPTLAGLQTWEIGELMLAKIRADIETDPRTKVVLAGHSRGGAAMLYVARKLQQAQVPVEAMVLFDAVRRALKKSLPDYANQVFSSGVPQIMLLQGIAAAVEATADLFQLGNDPLDVIPGNVRRALHVVRDERFSNYFLHTPEYLELAKAVQTKAVAAGHHMATYRTGTPAQQARLRALLEMHAALRDACRFDCKVGPLSTGFSFGNTGLTAEAPCRLTVVKYQATHGAMGGAPKEVSSYIKEPRYAAEIEAQEVISMLQIQARVNAFLAEINSAVSAGHQLQGAKLGYVPASLHTGQSQTALKR